MLFRSPDITGLVYDSRKAGPGTLFVCIVGTNSDSHRFLPQVFESGAAAVLVEKGHMPEGLKIPEHVTVYETEDTRLGLALASAAWFGYPAEQIPVIGVTGTKGKTTTTYMIRSILDHAGHKTGLIGTIEAIIGDQRIPSANTTPESYVVQKDLRAMIDAGCDCAVMEVSSQALKMHRTDGILFEITFEKYSDGKVYIQSADILPTWVNLRWSDGGNEYNMIPLYIEEKDQWQEKFGFNDEALRKAAASYDRTMAIVGEGLKQIQDFLTAEKTAREQHYLELAGQG